MDAEELKKNMFECALMLCDEPKWLNQRSSASYMPGFSVFGWLLFLKPDISHKWIHNLVIFFFVLLNCHVRYDTAIYSHQIWILTESISTGFLGISAVVYLNGACYWHGFRWELKCILIILYKQMDWAHEAHSIMAAYVVAFWESLPENFICQLARGVLFGNKKVNRCTSRWRTDK